MATTKKSPKAASPKAATMEKGAPAAGGTAKRLGKRVGKAAEHVANAPRKGAAWLRAMRETSVLVLAQKSDFAHAGPFGKSKGTARLDVPLTMDAQSSLVWTDATAASLREPEAPAGTGHASHWRRTILTGGLPAVLDALAAFDALDDLADVPGSTLYTLGETLAREFRKRVLLQELERTDWNLSHVAERLRLKGAGKVLEAIRSHGLEAAYDEAKSAGLVAGKSRKTRTTPT